MTNSGTSDIAVTIDSGAFSGQIANGPTNQISLVKASSGTLVLNGANSYTGPTTLTAGVLQLGNANAAQNSTVSVNVSGGLAFSAGAGGAFTLGGLAGAGNVSLQDTASGASRLPWAGMAPSTTYSGVLSGSGSLDKVGSGQLALTNRSSFSGGTTVNGGTLQLNVGGNAGALAAGAPITVNSGGLLRVNTTDALGYYNGSASAVNLNGGTLSIFVGGHAHWRLKLTGGVLTSTGSERRRQLHSQHECHHQRQCRRGDHQCQFHPDPRVRQCRGQWTSDIQCRAGVQHRLIC